jgi:hypothetical protein
LNSPLGRTDGKTDGKTEKMTVELQDLSLTNTTNLLNPKRAPNKMISTELPQNDGMPENLYSLNALQDNERKIESASANEVSDNSGFDLDIFAKKVENAVEVKAKTSI